MKKLRLWKAAFALVAFFFTTTASTAQNLYFPPLIGDTWATTSPSTLGWCQPKVDSLVQYLGRNGTKAFILLKDGRIVIEQYYDGFTKDSVWYWASAGKTLTAFLVGIAQQEGFLSINDTSSKYLGRGWTNTSAQNEAKITIRHQLTMTTGLDDRVADPYCTLPSCLQYSAEPGTRWAYHNGPYTLLDKVVQNASGQNLNGFVNQRLTASTGITGAFFPSGYNNVFVSKARSMARFGLLILAKGRWNGTPILRDTAYFNAMVRPSQSLNASYGYLWWLNGQSSYKVPGLQVNLPGPLSPNAPADMVAALGKNGQFINVVPSQNLVFIRLGNNPDGAEVPFLFNDSIWVRLNAAMCQPLSIRPSESSVDDLEVFPNPTQTTFSLKTNLKNIKSMRVSDLSGRLVWQAINPEDTHSIDASRWPSGLYFLHVLTDRGQVLTRKISVQH